MKRIALAAVVGFAASTAFAGGFDEPQIEPPVMIDVVGTEGSSSAGGMIIPLILLALLAAAAS